MIRVMSVPLPVRPFFQLFWIGVCAAGMLLQTSLLLDEVLPAPWLAGFVFGATVFGYNFAARGPRRLVAWLMGGLGIFCFFNISRVQQVATLAPFVIWLFYYDIRYPGRAGLRKYPAIKPIAIAIAWAWVTVLLPLPHERWTDTPVLFIGRAAFIFALALAYDLCDETYDRRKGFTTLVMQAGPHRAYRLIDAALLLASVCVVLNFLLGIYSLNNTLGLLVSIIAGRQLIRQLTTLIEWGDWRKIAIDALMVLQLGLVWISDNNLIFIPYLLTR